MTMDPYVKKRFFAKITGVEARGPPVSSDLLLAHNAPLIYPVPCAGAALEVPTAAVADTLKAGDKVQLVGFGSFEVKARAARTGKSPRTDEAIKLAAM